MGDPGRAEGRLLHREAAETSVLDRGRKGPLRHPGIAPRALLDVAIGGAVGALARDLIIKAMPGARHGFPWGTLLVNMLGCLFIGILTTYLLKGRPHPVARPLLVTGYLGGFTTFSHLIDGVHALGRAGVWDQSAVYAVVSVVGGWIAVAVGLWGGGLLPYRAAGSEDGAPP
ncbi:CrcB family protein [Actinomadura sp. WMMA1423]|uniref:FluC/FEX family fluoride channel n=1 Tax=Actinomadura sp. WMMA1423 TaxID=2591108 RepID=UPI0011461C14|nr:CrcB family protein [Actinomadura sp. WMMA1423]